VLRSAVIASPPPSDMQRGPSVILLDLAAAPGSHVASTPRCRGVSATTWGADLLPLG